MTSDVAWLARHITNLAFIKCVKCPSFIRALIHSCTLKCECECDLWPTTDLFRPLPSSSHRSEERQRCSTSRPFQWQGGRHIHCVGRGLHGGGAGQAQPSEGNRAATWWISAVTLNHKMSPPAFFFAFFFIISISSVFSSQNKRASKELWSHHVRCQMKFRKLSAQLINQHYLLCREHLVWRREPRSLDRISALPRALSIDLRPLCVCAGCAAEGSPRKGLLQPLCL